MKRLSQAKKIQVKNPSTSFLIIVINFIHICTHVYIKILKHKNESMHIKIDKIQTTSG